jgi:hypothetical protein
MTPKDIAKALVSEMHACPLGVLEETMTIAIENAVYDYRDKLHQQIAREISVIDENPCFKEEVLGLCLDQSLADKRDAEL